MSEFTFLTEEQVFGNKQLYIIKKYGTKCAITDFSILLGGYVDDYCTSDNISYTGWWWTKTPDGVSVRVVNNAGNSSWSSVNIRDGCARPALPFSSISNISTNRMRGKNGILEVEYGEYPQDIVSENFAKSLERAYSNRTINQTGKSYTTDSVEYFNDEQGFCKREHIEYEYNGKKYIRFVGDYNCAGEKLSDGRTIQDGGPYWIEVKPIKWLVDEKVNIALSKKFFFLECNSIELLITKVILIKLILNNLWINTFLKNLFQL